jgi:hypothetical protein
VVLVALSATFAPNLAAQRKDPAESAGFGDDPYTRGDAEMLAGLGYQRTGRMTWMNHDTPRIEEDLGNLPLRWIETEHFKIGCALPEVDVPRGREVREALGDELAALRERLPTVPRKARTLDPWLRTHLYAMRLERLYDRVQQVLGVTDEDFVRTRAGAPRAEPWRGRGAYLGLEGKFHVLLCEKQSTLGRYLRNYVGVDAETPYRWYEPNCDASLFVTCSEFAEGAFSEPHKMHAHVVFNVTHVLLAAFGGYLSDKPVWIVEGLAHGLRREITDEINDFSALDGDRLIAYREREWVEKVKQRLRHDLVRPWSEIAHATDAESFTLVDHVAVWSRTTWLLETRGEDAIGRYLASLSGRRIAESERATAFDRAFRTAFGADPDELDAEWKDWAKRQREK